QAGRIREGVEALGNLVQVGGRRGGHDSIVYQRSLMCQGRALGIRAAQFGDGRRCWLARYLTKSAMMSGSTNDQPHANSPIRVAASIARMVPFPITLRVCI